jgi:hypothetical protein
MWWRVDNTDLLPGRCSDTQSVLANTLAIASMMAVSAISGAAVLNYLADPSGTPERAQLPAVVRAATPPAPLETAEASGTAADRPLVPVVQQHAAATVGMGSDLATDRVAPPAPRPTPASLKVGDRELTFAWQYAQRHAAVSTPDPEPRVVATAGDPQPRNVRSTAGWAAWRTFATGGRHRHQALAYAGQGPFRHGWRAAPRGSARGFQDGGR